MLTKALLFTQQLVIYFSFKILHRTSGGKTNVQKGEGGKCLKKIYTPILLCTTCISPLVYSGAYGISALKSIRLKEGGVFPGRSL